MVLVERIHILNNYDCSMFNEECPNTWYFSDEMYKCKYLSLKYELYNSLKLGKLRVFNTINRSKLICMLLLSGRKHVTNKKNVL